MWYFRSVVRQFEYPNVRSFFNWKTKKWCEHVRKSEKEGKFDLPKSYPGCPWKRLPDGELIGYPPLKPVAGFTIPLADIRKIEAYRLPTKFGEQPDVPKVTGPLLQNMVLDEAAKGLYEEDCRVHVRRAWWMPSKRACYWGKWRVQRDWTRRQLIKEYGPYIDRLNALKFCTFMPKLIQDMEFQRFETLPGSCIPHHRKVNFICQFDGRWKGRNRRFRLSRIRFKRMCDYNKLSGVTKAMWG